VLEQAGSTEMVVVVVCLSVCLSASAWTHAASLLKWLNMLSASQLGMGLCIKPVRLAGAALVVVMVVVVVVVMVVVVFGGGACSMKVISYRMVSLGRLAAESDLLCLLCLFVVCVVVVLLFASYVVFLVFVSSPL